MTAIERNLPFEEYQKAEGINASLLKVVYGMSLQHAKAMLNGTMRFESDALDFGKLFHSLTLENRADYIVKPETYINEKGETKKWNGNATICKAWAEENAGKTIINQQQEADLLAMKQAVQTKLGSLFNGETEISLFAEHDGNAMRCRLDLLPYAEDAPIIDLKTTNSAKPEAFIKSAIGLGYHLQAAYAIDVAKKCGIDRKEFWLVAVETSAPYACTIVKFVDEPCSLLRLGRVHYRAAFKKLVNAMKTNEWPSYQDCAAEDYMPNYLKQELEQTV